MKDEKRYVELDFVSDYFTQDGEVLATIRDASVAESEIGAWKPNWQTGEPESSGDYLVSLSSREGVDTDRWCSSSWLYRRRCEVAAWLPLPEPCQAPDLLAESEEFV